MAEIKAAIWEKKTKAGGTYLSMALEIDGEKRNLTFFKNKKRDGRQSPV